MVGATGIEPVTPTMSTNGVDGNYSENRVLSAEKFAVRSRSDHPYLGRFMGDHDPPDPEMQSPAKAATEARAHCRTDWKHLNFSDDLTERQASITPLAIFDARCEARALLWAESVIDLHAAVDELQFSAVRTGLVARYGQDAIQQRMVAAFAVWRGAC